MRLDLTPQQKIKWLILRDYAASSDEQAPEYGTVTGSRIDAEYAAIDITGRLNDSYYALREEGQESGLPYEPCRHVEAKAVAYQLPDETWVGWTYYYGGGKHSNPEELEWIATAHNVHCVPTVMTVNVFQRYIEQPPEPQKPEKKTAESCRAELIDMKSGDRIETTDRDEAELYHVAAMVAGHDWRFEMLENPMKRVTIYRVERVRS